MVRASELIRAGTCVPWTPSFHDSGIIQLPWLSIVSLLGFVGGFLAIENKKLAGAFDQPPKPKDRTFASLISRIFLAYLGFDCHPTGPQPPHRFVPLSGGANRRTMRDVADLIEEVNFIRGSNMTAMSQASTRHFCSISAETTSEQLGEGQPDVAAVQVHELM